MREAPGAAPAEAELPPSRSTSMWQEPEEGPLWHSIKKQLYRSEVSHVKRLVGEALIQQNKLMWSEIASLRQILTDFQEQNDQLSEGLRQQVQFRGTQHRDLLRRQAQIILEDVRSQAESCGHTLEDLIPEIWDQHWRDYLFVKGASRSSKGEPRFSPPTTPSTRPSTRPSSSSGVSGCTTPDVPGAASLPLGRQLGVDELSSVAAGIREALEAEQESLLTIIGEQLQRLEAEDARRAESRRGEPSTQELQDLVHKLQDLAVSPSLRTLALTGPPSPGSRPSEMPDESSCVPVPLCGGASVRRLQALIAQRRRASPPPHHGLGAVPESPPSLAAPSLASFVGVSLRGCSGAQPSFDPFFDDPFA
uniref:Uncharacterized protein n=2 Tax=Alexandrium monilatum TaxID=311494 RepID=A0A7S4UEU0_9DINO|mmetsp:Transcript_78191/g.247074  ORF Transcript_78191/g.247074 Transcript_78191/m.247074 type:complete len:364 (+) Transcript_78191:71-1162(+)